MNNLLLISIAISLATTSSVFAQSDPVVVSGDNAYFFGKPDVIVPADASNITISPDRRYVLFAQNALMSEKFRRILPPVGPPAVDGVAIYQYDTRRGRSTILWKVQTPLPTYHSISEIAFLPDGQSAVVSLFRVNPVPDAAKDGNKETPLSYESMLLFINMPRGTARTVSYQEKQTESSTQRIFPAPRANEAILIYSTPQDSAYHLRLVSPNSLGETIPLDGNFVYWAKWNADGSEFAGRVGVYNSETKERTSKWFVLNRKTRVVAYQSNQPKWFTLDGSDNTPQIFDVPLRLTAARGVASVGSLKRDTPCVVVEGINTTDHYLLAADAEPITIVGNEAHRAILYTSNDAIYAAPVYTVPYSQYATYLRKSIEANAKQIDSAIEQWLLDNKATVFPKSPDAISLLVGDGKTLYLKRDYGFFDPRTKVMAFRNIYTGSADATGNTPRFAMETSVGKLTVYVDGDTGLVWDPAEPPAKP